MEINKNCVFWKVNTKKCNALTEMRCNGCKFAMTKEQFEKGKADSIRKLKEKYNETELNGIGVKYGIKEFMLYPKKYGNEAERKRIERARH